MRRRGTWGANYLLISSGRLEDGIRHLSRFASLLTERLRMDFGTQGDAASIVYYLGDETLAREHHVVDYLLMVTAYLLRRATGGDLQVSEVHVRHPDRGVATETERAFGCKVRFGRSHDRLVFPASALQVAPRLANPLIAEQIEKFAAALLSRLTPTATVRERVADATRALLATGVPVDLATVARRLGMSNRGLQRGLEDERTTFRVVWETVRREAAEALMATPALSVKAVAFNAGFGDVAAFSNAFKRWVGCAPTRYRERLAARAKREHANERTLARISPGRGRTRARSAAHPRASLSMKTRERGNG